MKSLAIIIPGYNCEKYVGQCLDSILQQDYINYRVFFIDDGSTDNTANVIAQHELKVEYIHQDNLGVSSARNNGIELAKDYEYIMFIDADDWLENNALKIMMEVANDKSNIDFILSDWNEYRLKEGRMEKQHHKILSNSNEGCVSITDIQNHYFRMRDGGSPWAKLYRMDIIRQRNIRFIEGLSYAEDYLFNLAYLEHAQNGYYICNPLYGYNCCQIGAGGRFKQDYFELMKKIESLKYSICFNGEKNRTRLLDAELIEQLSISINNVCDKRFDKAKRATTLNDILIYMTHMNVTIEKIMKSDVSIKSKLICIAVRMVIVRKIIEYI